MAYLDTSALLKWYVPEAGSDAFGEWIATQEQAEISRLTCLEVRSTLAKKLRIGQLDRQQAEETLARFQSDVGDGLFLLYTLNDEDWLAAEIMLSTADGIPLRSLDALHLAVAQSRSISTLATGDRVLADAARAIGMQPILF